MKKIKLLILILIFSNYIFSQNNEEQKVSIVSKNKDTLWLINNDLGRVIENAWSSIKYSEKKPKIIFVDSLPRTTYIKKRKK